MARILVIEDDATICDLMIRVLSMAGHEVLGAFDGEDGLRQFQHNDVDLIITDWNMPRKDGGEVIREALRLDPSSRIILVTATPSTDLTPDAVQGVQKVFPKPFELQALLNGVGEVLEGKHSPGL
jgi:two-component system, chemotaxis family, chemotaxis protein CheY